MESSKSMKAKILSILRQAQGYVSGQELCERLGVSRTAVWKSMKKLEEEGYVIDGVNRKGYRLMESPDAITAQEIESYLRCDRAFRCDFYQTENCTGTEVQDEKDNCHITYIDDLDLVCPCVVPKDRSRICR